MRMMSKNAIALIFISSLARCSALIGGRNIAISFRNSKAFIRTNANVVQEGSSARLNNFELQGFFDEFMDSNFGSGVAKKDEKNDIGEVEDDTNWNEADFRNEVEKRNSEVTTAESGQLESSVMTSGGEEEEEDAEFDGYMLRDAIYNKWGQCFDLEFQPVTTFGFTELYLNVMPFRLGGKRFRHKTELDYLCHLQAVVEILVKYDQLEYVLTQLEETNKKPRPGTSPLVAVPFRLDLTEDELESILN